MKSRVKKCLGWVAVSVMLVASVLSPLGVMANVNDVSHSLLFKAKADNNFEEMAALVYLAQAWDTCLRTEWESPKVQLGDKGIQPGGSTDSRPDENKARDKMRMNINLNSIYDPDYTLYNSYLDKLSTSDGDGKLTCGDLGKSEKGRLTIFLQNLGTATKNNADEFYNGDSIVNLWCGRRNGEVGIFNILVEDDMHEEGSNLTCRKRFEDLKKILDYNPKFYLDTNHDHGYFVTLSNNSDFSLLDFFENEIGLSEGALKEDNAEERLRVAKEWLTFQSGCDYTTIEFGEYQKNEGVTNYYKIFNGTDIVYINLNNNGTLYYGMKDDASTSGTCVSVAEKLSPDGNDATLALYGAKKAMVKGCAKVASENKEILDGTYNLLESIWEDAETLLVRVGALPFAFPLTLTGEDPFELDDTFDVNDTLGIAGKITEEAENIGEDDKIPDTIQNFINNVRKIEEESDKYVEMRKNWGNIKKIVDRIYGLALNAASFAEDDNAVSLQISSMETQANNLPVEISVVNELIELTKKLKESPGEYLEGYKRETENLKENIKKEFRTNLEIMADTLKDNRETFEDTVLKSFQGLSDGMDFEIDSITQNDFPDSKENFYEFKNPNIIGGDDNFTCLANDYFNQDIKKEMERILGGDSGIIFDEYVKFEYNFMDAFENFGNGSVDLCYGNSGSLGWIVCPVITWLSDTLNTVYTDMVEPFLIVNSELVESGSGSATYKAWDIFRNFANIAFVILFLVVIFSQLTGVGIDNYGIKKILPKLIVAAILINLSYVICQLMVDLSNILGSGLNSMFTSIAKEVPMNFNGDFNSGTWFAGLLNGLLVVLGIGGVGAIVGAAVGPGLLAGIILPLLMGLLVAFIAVIFFFALLGIRKAGVVLLVTLAPMAFACYMLPNTKKLFDKWLKIFEGLLLLYPICGMLIGGSVLTSRILVSASEGDFFVYLVGLLLLVVPFFFVPVLLKGSFAAMGNIGAKISGLGNKFGRGLAGRTDKGIRNSETFRRMDNATGRHSVFKARRAAAVAGTAALMQERSKRDRLGNRKNMQTRIDAIAAAEEAKATDEQTSQRLSLMMSSGSQGGIKMNDGTTKPYTLDSLTDRMTELRDNAKERALTSAERVELSALARGMAGMKGGAGKIGKIIRGAEVDDVDPATGAKKVNSNFMSAFGEIYAHDSAVQGKMNEKDVGASVFTEQFMPGGAGVGASPTFTKSFADYKSTAGYSSALSGRIKSYEVGLNQGGSAVGEYIESLSQRDCQAILDNDNLLNSLDVDVRDQFLDYAAGRRSTKIDSKTGNPKWDYSGTHTGWSVTQKTVQRVTGDVNANITGGTVGVQGSVGGGGDSSELVIDHSPEFTLDATEKAVARNYLSNHDLSKVSTEQLRKIASNPNASNGLGYAAMAEINRRNGKPGNA